MDCWPGQVVSSIHFGGGGWGPSRDHYPDHQGQEPAFCDWFGKSYRIFVTLASAFTFFTLLGVTHWQVIVALIVGGLLAAPIAAKLTGKLPRKTSMILFGSPGHILERQDHY